MLAPSDSLTRSLEELRGLDAATAAARTGELVARHDRRWQLAHNAGQPLEQEITDFLTVVLVHVNILAETGQLPEAETTLIFGLLSTDISRARREEFGQLWIRGLYTLGLLTVSLADSGPSAGAATHLDVCARYALGLFEAQYTAWLEGGGAPVGEEAVNMMYEQLRASDIAATLPPLHGQAPRLLDAPGEVLVDILTRLRACGLATV